MNIKAAGKTYFAWRKCFAHRMGITFCKRRPNYIRLKRKMASAQHFLGSSWEAIRRFCSLKHLRLTSVLLWWGDLLHMFSYLPQLYVSSRSGKRTKPWESTATFYIFGIWILFRKICRIEFPPCFFTIPRSLRSKNHIKVSRHFKIVLLHCFEIELVRACV